MEQQSEKSDRAERMTTTKKLITNSVYSGIWLDSLKCMEGYGIYMYPDGSQYRGYFYRGRFHGYGTLYLSEPYGFTYKGTFHNGKLIEVEDMWFDDGLSVDAHIDGCSMDFSSWKYCTKNDRRFADEHREGLQPVGPLSMLTADRPTRQMHKNCYELDKGVFDPLSRMISKRPPPFAKTKFVSSPEEVEWILKNCRHGPLTKINIDPRICHEIIRNNLESELEVEEHVQNCNYDQAKLHKDYFGKLCESKNSLSKTSASDLDESKASDEICFTSSSCTNSSFSDIPLKIDVQEILFQADEYQHYDLGRNLSQEADLMVNKHAAPNILTFKS